MVFGYDVCIKIGWYVGGAKGPLPDSNLKGSCPWYQPVRSMWAHSHWITLSQQQGIEQTNRSSTRMLMPLVRRDFPFVFYFILKWGFIHKWIKCNSLNKMLRRTALSPPKYIPLGKMLSMLNEFSLILCILVWQKLKFVSAGKKGCFYFAKSLSNASLIPLESLNIKNHIWSNQRTLQKHCHA